MKVCMGGTQGVGVFVFRQEKDFCQKIHHIKPMSEECLGFNDLNKSASFQGPVFL